MRTRHPIALVAALIAVAAGIAPAPASAAKAPRLEAGVGRAEITPPTGFAFGGWVRADRVATGVHTRLQASALVLESGNRKLALVAVDLFAAPGGLVKDAAELAGRGFSEENVLVSASHTHGGPSGFANFTALNTLAPSVETITDPTSFTDFINPAPADPQLYSFLVRRVATALRRADRDVGPARAAWATTNLRGVTKNRSVEAHLADHGVIREYGAGSAAEDPQGEEHTVDSLVSVLRVDRVRRRGATVPLGGWTNFADHGTVNPASFLAYNQDHHGAALRTLEAKIRRRGDVPRGEPVIAVYGNSNEGDMSAGLDGQGPAIAERAGRREAKAMFKAWRRAGRRLAARPEVDLRWTRVCFCGQRTAAGRVADEPLAGLPFLTGSEENRGPLYDITGVPFEGRRAPVEGFESQGHKIGVAGALSAENYPTAVPLFVVRVGERLVISLPGEPTIEVGRRARAAAVEAAGNGVRGATVAGLANEFIQYLTTPEEYDRQHYEGGSTIFGPASSVLLTEQLTELAARMRRGEPAQQPAEFDPTNGVSPDAAPYPRGAQTGAPLGAPPDAPPGTQTAFEWTGGPSGLDKPLDKRFISIQRRGHRGWKRVADDLGLAILWTVDDAGAHSAHWQVPKRARTGRYRFVVSANRYRLRSEPFRVAPGIAAPELDPSHPASKFAPITRR